MGTAQSTNREMVRDELENKLDDPNATPMSLPLEFLKAITCDFSTESILGEGGYGVVYKGVLRSGKIIAVKKLSELRLKDEAFRNEVSYFLGIKHKNIVKFVAYCAESSWEAVEVPSGSGKHIFAEMPKRLLCFEYVPNQSLDKHISDASSGLEWNMRYEIIKGVCTGLSFLHEECRIVHLDLKPENILMDSTMTPKIADFGLSKLFGEQQSRLFTDNRVGTRGYMAPEYLDRGEVSNKADIFSLGVIVIEIITGHRNYPYFQQDSPHSTGMSLLQFIEEELQIWRNFFVCTPKYKHMEIYIHEVRQCITIALRCVDPSMDKRPTAKDIIQMLNELDQVTASSTHLLDVHPLELYFPVEPNKSIPCSLYLTNKKDKHVLYMLMEKTYNGMGFLDLPIYGILPPRSSVTLVVTTNRKENLPEEIEDDLVLLTDTSDEHLPDYDAYDEWHMYFDNVEHGVSLKATYALQGKTTCEANPPLTQIISMEKTFKCPLYSFDVNRIEPWILTAGKDGYVDIWNYDMQKLMGSVQIGSYKIFYAVKFIERKRWFIAGSTNSCIYVYNYKFELEKITSFIGERRDLAITSLAVHPTKPYVLAAHGNCIRLWDWDNDWECIKSSEEQSDHPILLALNPEDTNSIASISKAGLITIWSLDSLKPKYTLSGPVHVSCLDFFTRDDRQYLISGSIDGTAKIWDMQTKECIYTLEGFMTRVVSVVSHPSLRVLITSTVDGVIDLWSSTDFRHKRTIKISGYECPRLACLMGPRRVMIAYSSALWMMEIDDEEPGTS